MSRPPKNGRLAARPAAKKHRHALSSDGASSKGAIPGGRADQRTDDVRILLEAIVNSSSDAIVGKTCEGIITSWNPGAERIFGYTAQEAIGQSTQILFPAGELNEELDILARIARGEQVQSYDTVRLRKDGTPVQVSVTVSPITDGHGTVVGASKIARDISRRKHAEAALRVSEERFRAYVEQAADALFVFDGSGQILDVNMRTCTSLGYRREELLGMNRRDVEPELGLGGSPPNWDAILPGTPVTTLSRHRCKAGTTFPVEIQFSSFDLQGTRRYMGLARDITERDRVEAERRESEERFRAMANSIPQLAWTARADGFIFWYNQRWYDFTAPHPSTCKVGGGSPSTIQRSYRGSWRSGPRPSPPVNPSKWCFPCVEPTALSVNF